MARFRLTAGAVSRAVRHRTVDELWYVVDGRGEMWRQQGARSEVVALEAGVAVSIPVGTDFQFRADVQQDLVIVGVTMPPWPDADEAMLVEGCWPERQAQAPSGPPCAGQSQPGLHPETGSDPPLTAVNNGVLGT